MSRGNTKYIATKSLLDQCCDSLNVAYWTNDSYHVAKARDELMSALSGSQLDPRGHLEDLIESAIDDTIDVDWTSAQAAKHIVDVLLDDAIPAIPEGDDQ